MLVACTQLHQRFPVSNSFTTRKNEVDVWAVRTIATPEVISRFETTLAPDQMERAGRYHFEHLRHKYVLAAGALRFLIGRYLGIPPAAVEFVYGRRGKPALGGNDAAVHFNISHSGELAVFAFTTETEVGIDIEKIRSIDSMLSIASQYFCAAETNTLRSLEPEQSRTAFFNCWTRRKLISRRPELVFTRPWMKSK